MKMSRKPLSIKDLIFTKVLDPFQHYINTPLKQHKCKDCGDMFIFKSSYMDHIFRDSISIKFLCKVCKKTFQYSNRCSVLNHISSHISVNPTINLTDIIVEPSTHHLVTITTTLEEDEETVSMETFDHLKKSNMIVIPDNEDAASNIPSLFFEPPRNNVSNINSIIENINNSFDTALRECEEDYNLNMFDNSQTVTPPDNSQTVTPLDNSQTITPDSLQTVTRPVIIDVDEFEASSRTLTGNVSGSHQVPLSENLQISAKRKNLTNSNNVTDSDVHSCQFCSFAFEPDKTVLFNLRVHFSRCKKPMVCSECNICFGNSCSYHAHKSMHSLKPPFVCPECGTKSSSLYSHYKHIVLSCFYFTKTVLSRYVKSDSKPSHVSKLIESKMVHTFSCSFCSVLCPDLISLSNHAMQVHRLATVTPQEYFFCNACAQRFLTKSNVINHIQTAHLNKGLQHFVCYKCPGCKMLFRSLISLKNHMSTCTLFTHSEFAKYILDLRSFPNTQSSNVYWRKCLKCSLISCHEIPKLAESSGSPCIFCSLDISNTDDMQLSDNFSFSKDCYPKLKPKRRNGFGVKKNHSSVEIGNDTKRRRRTLRNKNQYSTNKGSGSSGISITPIGAARTDELKCAKCHFMSKCKESFTAHILAHRDSSTSFQCMECGTCFVTKQSLSCHLIIAHGIANTDEYIKLNQCQDISVAEDGMNDQETNCLNSVNENQCEVCMEQFDTSKDLDKHFRTHGMAFILAKQKNKNV